MNYSSRPTKNGYKRIAYENGKYYHKTPGGSVRLLEEKGPGLLQLKPTSRYRPAADNVRVFQMTNSGYPNYMHESSFYGSNGKVWVYACKKR